MYVYELTHLFFRHAGQLVDSPKNLGLYPSYESAGQAMEYYRTKPGFCDNENAFSFRERFVFGNVMDDTVFEAMVYFHTDDYELEETIELGLFGDEPDARSKLEKYLRENADLLQNRDLICEEIVNKCVIGRKQWPEGFSVSA